MVRMIMGNYREEKLEQEIVGKKVLGVYLDEDLLAFDTTQGTVGFSVEGDCCSHSSFHDILGVRKLIESGPVIKVEEVPASFECDNYSEPGDDSISNYGYAFVADHPTFGEITCVVSFRNNSNGYYGGWMESGFGYGQRSKSDTIPFGSDDVILS
jgi:hypothetical protein